MKKHVNMKVAKNLFFWMASAAVLMVPGYCVAINPQTSKVAPQPFKLSLSMLAPTIKYAERLSGVVNWSGALEGDADAIRQYSVLMHRLPTSSVGVPLDIVLSASPPESAPSEADRALSHAEGFWLVVNRSMIRLQAATNAGIARGLVRLAALSKQSEKATFPMGQWADWPDLSVRAVHFVLSGRINLIDMRRMAELASAAEFNTLIVLVTPSVGLSAFGDLSKNATISQAQFASFVEYAKQSGLTVIPGLKLLTHQEKLFGDHYPSLMYNRWTYDPRIPKVYKIVFPIIDQLLDITGATEFMIGHDELAGWKKARLPKVLTLPTGQSPLPADLFVRDIRTLNKHLQKRGVQTWMWGDMLLQPSRFPNVQRVKLHGRLPGYGSALWKVLPKDIVICDWDYTGDDFEPVEALVKYGFPVMGATWKDAKTIKDFSEFAARHGARGMIATIWFYLQRHQWRIIERIIQQSGNAFWNANPR